MRAKRKMLISIVIIAFVLLAVVGTIAVTFALTQQTIKTSLNIGYTVQDIDGTASATFTIGGVEENLTAYDKNGNLLGNTLVFKATDTEDAGNLMFPEDGLALTKRDDNVVIKYTYTNTGDKHYVATMSFDAELTYENMNVEYGIWDFNTNQIKYSNKRYALVVPADQTLSYWIRISIRDKARSASFNGDFSWYLEGSDKNTLGYEEILAFEFTGGDGVYAASYNGNINALDRGSLIIPSELSGNPVTSIVANTSLTAEQRQAVTSVFVPKSIETIGWDAFESYINLEEVNFEQNEIGISSIQNGTGLTNIGAGAFQGCSSLKDIIIPNTVTTLGEAAFMLCENLTSINIPDGVTILTTNIFSWCESLISINIPDSVTEIQDEAFLFCTALNNVSLGNGVKSIGYSAFESCDSLTSIVIPESVTYIDFAAFACNNLTSVTFKYRVWNIIGEDNEYKAFLETELDNPLSAATYLKSTYVDCRWMAEEDGGQSGE